MAAKTTTKTQPRKANSFGKGRKNNPRARAKALTIIDKWPGQTTHEIAVDLGWGSTHETHLRDQLLKLERKGLVVSVAKFGPSGGTKERRWYPVKHPNALFPATKKPQQVQLLVRDIDTGAVGVVMSKNAGNGLWKVKFENKSKASLIHPDQLSKKTNPKRKRYMFTKKAVSKKANTKARAAAKSPRPASAKKPVRSAAAKSPRRSKPNPQKKFSKATLVHLRREFEKIDGATLAKHQAQFDKVFAQTSRTMLLQLANAKIEWVSQAAKNALVARRNNPKKKANAFETAANIAVVLSGLEHVRRLMKPKRKKRTTKKKPNSPRAGSAKSSKKKPNLGLLDVAANLQAADYLRQVLSKKKKKANAQGSVTRRSNQKARARGMRAVASHSQHGNIRASGTTRRRNTTTLSAVALELIERIKREGPIQLHPSSIAYGEALRYPGTFSRWRTTAGFLKIGLKKSRTRQSNPNDGRIFREFTGSPSTKVLNGFCAHKSEPTNVDQLGTLTEIKLNNLNSGPILRFPIGTRKNAAGQSVLVFSNSLVDERGKAIKPERIHRVANPSILCAKELGSGQRRFVLASKQPLALQNGRQANKVLNYGVVVQLSYRAPKPHLYDGDTRAHEFYHNLGEEGGRQPQLKLDNGWWRFHGGDYKIRQEGIRD